MPMLASTYSVFIESVCNQFDCREALPALQEGFRAYCESADPFNMETWDPYGDRQYDMGFSPSDTSDSTLSKAFIAGKGDYALNTENGQALYQSIKKFLLRYTTGKFRIYRGVGISARDWDNMIRRSSGKTNKVDEETIWTLLANTRKKYNSYTAVMDIAKMYARGAINDGNGNDEHIVGIVFSVDASPEDINFPMSMALNAKDNGRGFELVVTDDRKLDNFRIELSNIDSLPRDTCDSHRHTYPIGCGKFAGITYDREDNCYYLNMLHGCPGFDNRRMSVPTNDSRRVMGPFSEITAIGDGLYLARGLDYDRTVIVKGDNGRFHTVLDDSDHYSVLNRRFLPNGVKILCNLTRDLCNAIVTAGTDSGRILFDRWFYKVDYDEDSDTWYGIDKDGSETELDTDYTAEKAESTSKFSWEVG